MPWRALTVNQQRQEFLALAQKPSRNLSELCRRFGISRKTAYKWLARDTTEDQSRRPKNSPKRSNATLEAQVLAVRDAHPAWGGRKIAHVLMRDQQLAIAPSTVTSILHRHNRISPQASEAATPWQRFEHPWPNALWQMDFKGHFGLTDNSRCHPLTVLDDHSRYNIILQALPNERREGVQEALSRAFEQFGLPERINTDNGAPWGNSGQGGLTALEVWLIRLGIRLSHSRPHHPQTNGKEERFHRSLKAEVIDRHSFCDMTQVQQQFDRWRYCYNHERPHEALGLATPAKRYRISPRAMPRELPPIEYPDGDVVRKVQQGGWISLHNVEIRTSTALTGQPVGCRPVADCDGAFGLYFCHQKIGEFCLSGAVKL